MFRETSVEARVFAVVLFVSGILFFPLVLHVWKTGINHVNEITQNLAVWDFLNVWSAGTLLTEGRISDLYDPASFSAWQRQMFDANMERHEWSYPPTMLLLAVPLAKLPLLSSYFIWTAGSLLLLATAMLAVGAGRTTTLLALISPAVMVNMALGQNGALTAAALIGGLGLMSRKPVIAGVLLGLLVIKPHLAILVPICLIASRNWIATYSAIVTGTSLIVASTLMFGWECWALYFTETRPHMQAILEASWGRQGFQNNAITTFSLARSLGAEVNTSYLIQSASTVASVIVTWKLWQQREVAEPVRIAITVALTFLSTPYAWAYDLVSLCAGIVMLVAYSGWKINAVLYIAWVFPGISLFLTEATNYPVGPILFIAMILVCWNAFVRHETRRHECPQ